MCYKRNDSDEDFFKGRTHPQNSFAETGKYLVFSAAKAHLMFKGLVMEQADIILSLVVDNASFFGRIRQLFSHTVLKTQLEQMRRTGAYDGFSLEWKDVYHTRRLHGGNWRVSSMKVRAFDYH